MLFVGLVLLIQESHYNDKQTGGAGASTVSLLWIMSWRQVDKHYNSYLYHRIAHVLSS